MMFLDCPAYMDEDGAERCGLPAEVTSRFIMRSTDGPVESAMIRCPAGHWFNGPIEFLTWDGKANRDPVRTGVMPRQRRDSRAFTHDSLDGGSRAVIQGFPGKPAQQNSRPNGAPAYYLGRPAWLWMTATGPRRRRTTPMT